MGSGEKNRRIYIERKSVTQNDLGEEIETWSQIAAVWASWRRASARETLAASEISSQVTDVFEANWSDLVSDVSPKDRLIYRDMIYDIAEATEIGLRQGLMITGAARSDG